MLFTVLNNQNGFFSLICPHCEEIWSETAHTLYNVVALRCEGCRRYSGLRMADMHGDTPVDPNDDPLEE